MTTVQQTFMDSVFGSDSLEEHSNWSYEDYVKGLFINGSLNEEDAIRRLIKPSEKSGAKPLSIKDANGKVASWKSVKEQTITLSDNVVLNGNKLVRKGTKVIVRK